jgi:hypothetical protein
MGVVDVIAVVLTNAVAIGNLALAVAAYRRARPAAPPITCTVDGTTLSISGPPDVAERTIREFLEARASLPPADDTHPS